MKATIIQRAAPLLITTMLAAAPAWAQQSGTTPNNSSPGTLALSAPADRATPVPDAGAGQPSGTRSKGMGGDSRHAVGRQRGESMQNLVERRIADMHARLHITGDQAQQWEQFAQVMRDNAKEIDQSYQQRAGKLASMSAVDNMQSFAQIEQQRAQDVQKLVPVFQALYGSLTEQQKRTADDMFRTYADARSRRPTSTN